MKKILLNLVSISLLAGPAVALAQPPAEAPELEIIPDVLIPLTNWLFGILLIVAAIFIIVAAFYFVTASGDPDKTKTARNFVLYAVIGVLVAFAAKGLVYLVGQIVGYEVSPW